MFLYKTKSGVKSFVRSLVKAKGSRGIYRIVLMFRSVHLWRYEFQKKTKILVVVSPRHGAKECAFILLNATRRDDAPPRHSAFIKNLKM